MTASKDQVTASSVSGKLPLAQILEILVAGRLPLRFTAYDGSATGPDDAMGFDLVTPRGTTYLATAPGELGLARAYVSGDLQPHGVHPGDPYELLKALNDVNVTTPPARVLTDIVRSIGIKHLLPIPPPPQEVVPRWRRTAQGLRHSLRRDAEAIHHHYDVSNTFYEWVLGPSMTYTCACYPHADAMAQREGGELADQPQLLGPRQRVQRDVGDPLEQRVDVALDLQLAGDVGPGQTQRARRGGQPGQRPRRGDPQRRLRRVGTGLAAVVAEYAHGEVRPQHAADDVRDLHVIHRPTCPATLEYRSGSRPRGS